MKINIPTHCPECGSELELVADQLFCRNKSCPAQLFKKVEHFTKVLGIKGFGPKTIEKLALSDLTEIFYLDEEDTIRALGEKTATKLLEEIEKAKSADLATVLASFSIPLIGETASGKITKIVKHIDDITTEKCREAGLGEKATANLVNFLNTDFLEFRTFLPFNFKSKEVKEESSTSLTVCITGKLSSFKTKAEAHKVLSDLGYKPVDSVTKALDILVDEENKGSEKRRKAESYGAQIITNLQEFIKSH